MADEINIDDPNYWDIVAPKKTSQKPTSNLRQQILDEMRGGTSSQESNGDYQAVNKDSFATGEFQVMPENIPVWTQKHLKRRMSVEEFKKDPQAQRQVFYGEMGEYVDEALKRSKGDATIAKRMASAAWYGGKGSMDLYDDPKPQYYNGKKYPSFREYTLGVVNKGKTSTAPAAAASFWDTYNPNQNTENPASFWDVNQNSQNQNPANVVNTPNMSVQGSLEPDPDYVATNGLVADTPEKAQKSLIAYREQVKAEFERAKTPARRKILQTRLETIDGQIRESAKKTATTPAFQPVGETSVPLPTNPNYTIVPGNGKNPSAPSPTVQGTQTLKDVPPVYQKRDVSKLQNGDKFYQFEKDGKTENGDEYLGTVNGKHRFKNADGDEVELDENTNSLKVIGTSKKLRLQDKSEYDLSENQSDLKQGETRYSNKRADMVLQSDGKVRQENFRGINSPNKLVLGEELTPPEKGKPLPKNQSGQLTQVDDQTGLKDGETRLLGEDGKTYIAKIKSKTGDGNQYSIRSENGQSTQQVITKRNVPQNQQKTNFGVSVETGDFQPTLTNEQKQQKDAQNYFKRPNLVEAKNSQETLDKGAAGSGFVDLAKRPKGENAGKFILREGLFQIAPKYGLTNEEIDSYVASNAGADYYKNLDEKGANDAVTSLTNEYGNAQVEFVPSYRVINEILNKRNNSQISEKPNSPVEEMLGSVPDSQYDSIFKSDPKNKINPELSQQIETDELMTPQGLEKYQNNSDITRQETAARFKTEEEVRKTIEDPTFWDSAKTKIGEGLSFGTGLKWILRSYGVNPAFLEESPIVSPQERKAKNEELFNQQISAINRDFGNFRNYRKVVDYAENMSNTEYSARLFGGYVRGIVNTAISSNLKGIDVVDSLIQKAGDYVPLYGQVPEQYRPSLLMLENGIGYTIASMLGKGDQFVASRPSDGVDSRLFYNLGKRVEEFMGDDKYLKNNLGYKLSEGLGSATGFLLIGLIAPEASIGQGLRTFSLTSGASGALGQAGSMYSDAKSKGLSESDSLWAGFAGLPLGATEGFGVGSALNRALKVEERRTFTKLLLEFVSEGAEESGQETLQNVGQDAFFQFLQDKNPSLYGKVKNVISSLPENIAKNFVDNGINAFWTGGVFGGAVQGATSVAERLSNGKQEKIVTVTENNPEFIPVETKAESTEIVKEDSPKTEQKPVVGSTVSATVGGKTKVGTVTEVKGKRLAVEFEDGSKTFVKDDKATVISDEENSLQSASPSENVQKTDVENKEVTDTEKEISQPVESSVSSKPKTPAVVQGIQLQPRQKVETSPTIEESKTFTMKDLDIVSGGTALAKKGDIVQDTIKIKNQLKIGDKITFFLEGEKTGVWDGNYIIEDKTKNPWGIMGILAGNKDGWIRRENQTSDTNSNGATLQAHEAATSPTNDLPEPSIAQIEAGNYKKGHININGLNISVENPVGSERKGVDRDGKAWSVKMGHHYGYIKRTVGADKENIDIFVKDNTPNDFAGDVFVVDQVHPDSGKFDEHKVMLGFGSEKEAREAYSSNYAKDWKGLKSITAMSFDDFKKWSLGSEQSKPANSSKKPLSKNEQTAAKRVEETTNFYRELENNLNNIKPANNIQTNVRSDISRALVNEFRKIEGLPPYTGNIENLFSAVKEADSYRAGEFFSELINIENAKKWLRDKAQERIDISKRMLANAQASEEQRKKRETEVKTSNDVSKTEEPAQTNGDSVNKSKEVPSNTEIQNAAMDIISELYDEVPQKFSGKNEKVSDALKGLADIFGDEILLKSVIPPKVEIDEAKYAQSKELFKVIVDELGNPNDDVNTTLRNIIETLKNEYNFSKDGVVKLVPYMAKFIEESRNPLQNEENESKSKKEVKSDVEPKQPSRNDQGSDANEISSDVQRTEPVGNSDRSDNNASEKRDGNVSRNTQRQSVENLNDETGSTREDSTANDAEQSSDGNSDKSSDGISDGIVRNDYVAPVGTLSREGSWRETARRNLDIIELVKKLENENRQATPEEQSLLVKFTGWGASEIANALFPGYSYSGEIRPEYAKDGWKELAQRAKDLFTPEELKTAASSTRNAHYTSEKIVRGIWDAVAQFGFSGGKVLEPGMGVGLFGVAAPESIFKKSRYTGIERDSMTARIAKQILQKQAVLENDFVKQNLPDNFFDVAIGNPPFSDTKILNDPRYKKYRFMTHDYFFAKSIDKVRPGGILVFVTSKGTMDKTDPKMREYIAERADLLGAIRLPQTAFKENAGTEVVTDVLFFRKRFPDEIASGENWITLDEITAKNKQGEEHKGLINEYFINHPEMVLGEHSFQGSMYKANEYTVKPLDGDIEELFKKAIENLPTAVYSQMAKSQETIAKVAERDWSPTAQKEGSLYIHTDGRLMRREDGSGVELTQSVKLAKTEEKWLRDYVGVRIALKQAQSDQLSSSEENPKDWETSLAELNSVYDSFVRKHGNILQFSSSERTSVKDDGTEITTVSRRFKNNKVLNLDVESPLVEALETITEDGQIVKSAMLLGRTIKPPQKAEIKELSDALAVSLDTIGKLNLTHVAELMQPIREGLTKDDVIKELGNAVYESPSGEWQLADEYLSGFVIDKLEEAETAAKSDRRFQRNVEALRKVQPQPIEHIDINASLGAAWVGAKYVSDFAREVVGLKGNSVTFQPMTNTWLVDGADGKGSRSLRDASNDWGTSDRSSNELLDSALNNRTVKITFKDSDGKTHTDVDSTALANEKIKKMRDAFRRWIWSDAKRAQTIAEKYNRQFNNIAPRSFEGTHLSTPGLSSRYKLHPHQKRAVWRILQTGNTYLAHAVGAGKTLEMIVSGMEQKRLGLISKPMYVVPNHMLKQFSSEFLEAYPLANILVADENNFAKEKRQRFTAQAALNDLDAVIITHSAFGLIRTKQETADVVINEMIEQMRMAILELDETDRAEQRTIKDLENRIDKIRQKFGSLTDATNKDDVINFEDLGVDFVYTDEAHEFRKLDFVTNRTNVKGIDPKGSQRSLDLLIKLTWLESQRPGRSAVLASGTPITNTLAELYSIMRYLDPAELETAEMAHFDAWSAQFGEVVADYEMNAAGNYEIVERFSKFVNIPELMKRARKFMDVLTLNQLGSLINLPTLKGGQPEIVVVKPTEAQTTYLKDELAQRIETSRKWKPSKDQQGNPDPLINIITDGRLAAIDMRYVDPQSPNDPNSKLNLMIDKIIEKYNETKDLEYKDKNTGETDQNKGAAQIVFSAVGFGDQVARKRGFDAKAWMIKRLTESGIPQSEIAFMSDYKLATAKERMFQEMRQGTKKILIGSPKNMGTGVNVQKRLKIEHYLSPPWYPADVEQPDGRIIRQGNQNEEIEIYRYATKGTYDSTAWAMIARKSRAIEQAMTGDDSQRSLEDISESSQYEMASAVSAGDDRAIKLAGLRRDIEKLERLRGAHSQEQRRLGYDRQHSNSVIKNQTQRIEKYENALKAIGTNIVPNDAFRVTIGSQTFEKRTEMGDRIKSAWTNAIKSSKSKAINKKEDVTVEIGKVLGKFPLEVTTFAKFSGVESKLKIDIAGVAWDLTNVEFGGVSIEEINDIDAVGLSTRIYNGLNSISKAKSESQRMIAEEQRKIKQIDSKVGQPFAEEQELYEKIAEYAQLQAEMAGEGTNTNNSENFLNELNKNLASVAIEKVINRYLDKNSVFNEDDFVSWNREPQTLKSVLGNENIIEFDGLSISVNPNPNLTGEDSQIQYEAIQELKNNTENFVNEYFTRNGKKIVNADRAKELFSAYKENPLKNDKSIHTAASALARLIFQKQLRDLPKGSNVQLSAGGQGSGKSTVIKNSPADLVYDSVMGSKEGNRRVIDAIIENGHHGLITFVFRPIENAVVGNMKRSDDEGRLVSENNIIHGHFNSLSSFLDDTAPYAESNNFVIRVFENIENQGLKLISLEDLANLRYTNIEDVRQRANKAFEQEYETNSYKESIREEFYRVQQIRGTGNSTNLESEDNSATGSATTQENGEVDLKQVLPENLPESERLTYEEIQNLPYVPFDELLGNAQIEQFGDKIKANPQSHEIFRRAFEEGRIRAGQTKLGSTDTEDSFAGVFLKPETIQNTINILQTKAKEAKNLGYSADEIAVFSNHAKMLESAAKIGKGTAIVYVFDKALPEELFHQADYLGSADKAILNRHDADSIKKLDAHPITAKLWQKHFSSFNEYRRLSGKMTQAVLRAEIAPMLVEMSDADLQKYGITKDQRDDYLLTWFEGYANRNGIDALDNFEREELNVQEFIEKVKETNQIRSNGQTNEADSSIGQIADGETRRGPPSSGQDENRRLSTGDESTKIKLGDNQKFASLPATLRRAGIDADDVVYEVFGDKAAQASARRILEENGIEGSIRILNEIKTPDVDHAILSFMIQRMFLDRAAELSSTNPEESKSLRERALKLGREHALKAVNAGRFTRAASIIQNSVEGVIYTAQGIVEDKYGEDKSLSAEQITNLENIARQAEEALAKVTALNKEKINLQRKIKRLETEKEAKKRKRSEISLKSRRKLVDLVKDQQSANIEAIKQKLMEQFAPAALKSIMGENANLSSSDLSKLSSAKAMSDVGGFSAEEIYNATGWERGADGKWRTDLSGKFDLNHKLLRSMLFSKNVEWLDSVIDAPELFSAYPDLRNIQVAFERLDKNVDAVFDPDDNAIILNDVFKWLTGLGLTIKRGGLQTHLKHEIQHAIQYIEDFTTGTNSQIAGFDYYWNKPGEVEARNAEKRLNLSPEEKQKTPISQTEDVSRETQLEWLAQSEPATLKQILSDDGGFDEETLNNFAQVGAMFLTEGLASENEYLPDNFYADMVNEFGDIIGSNFQEIYLRSWNVRDKWLSDIRKERTKESVLKKFGEDLTDSEVDDILSQRKEVAARRRAIEQIHKLTSQTTSKSKDLERLNEIIVDTAKDENEAVTAVMINEKQSTADIYNELTERGVEKKSDQRDVLRRASALLDEAKKLLNEENSRLLEEIAATQKQIREIGDLQWKARNLSRQASTAIENELRRIKSGELTYRGGQIVDVLNASRTLMASFDLSGAMRQGGFFTFAKPELQAKAFGNMFKSFSEKNYGRAISDIQNHPRFILAQRAGIDFAEAGKNETDHEELYRGKQTLEKIPYLGKILNTTITGWSERTYTAFLDTQRMVIFDVLAQELESSGLSIKKNKAEFEKVAQFINVATGRGSMPSSQVGKLLLDMPFFAPRYTLSRLQLLNMTLNPVAYYNMPPASRKIVAKSAARFYGTTAAILFLPALLGLVSFDPDDDEFLKIKVGNTKYDIWAGELQPAKLIIKLVHTAIRGERIPGEMWYDTKKNVGKFIQGKLSPLVSLGFDWLTGEDFAGNEFAWNKAIASRLMPITFNDIYESYKLDGVTGVARSLPFSMFGVGVTNYKARLEKPRTEAEKLATKAMAMKMASKPQTDEEREERKVIQELTARSRAGEDVSLDIDSLVKAGKLSKEKVGDILAAKDKTLLVDKAEGLSLDEFTEVYKVANTGEKSNLTPLLNKKMKNAEKENELPSDKKAKLESLGGKVTGDFPIPNDVKQEFDEYDISIPDVGETISVKKGEKTKLSTEQYEKYRREALERIYKLVQDKITSDAYKQADPEKRKEMIQKAINKGRAKELKETKQDIKKLGFQAY